MLELLGWDNSEACERLGTSYPGVIDPWRDGTIPIPPYVASPSSRRSPARCIWGWGGQAEIGMGTHWRAESGRLEPFADAPRYNDSNRRRTTSNPTRQKPNGEAPWET